MRHALIPLCLLLLSTPAGACLPGYGDTPLPEATLTETPGPTPTLGPPELPAAICAYAVPLRDDPVMLVEYWDVLACLGMSDDEVYHLWQFVGTTRLPVRNSPHFEENFCYTNFANNWCDCQPGGALWYWCECDGIYLTDFGSGPGPRRVAGTIVTCGHDPVIVVPESCTVGHDAWRHELIHLCRQWSGDPNWPLNDGFEGWRCE